MPNPVTLGAIDAGSNALRAAVATVGTDTRPQIIDTERIPVRLGHGAFTRGKLDVAVIDQAIVAFSRFKKLFDDYQVEQYRAVATSAVRGASNRELLQHHLFHETGIELEIISGREEARLVRKAVLSAFPEGSPPGLIVDLGGGSLELSVNIGPRWDSVSLPIGTVRLLETLGIAGAVGADEAQMIRRVVTTGLKPFRDKHGAALRGISAAASGGNPEALAVLLGGRTRGGLPELSFRALREQLPAIAEATIEQRIERFGVSENRAEVIGVAAVVLEAVGSSLGLDAMAVPGVGVREGVLAELAVAATGSRPIAAEALHRALLSAAHGFAARLGHDTSHGTQVRRIALMLFDALSGPLRLDASWRAPLELAALLHDVGEVVHRRGHHRHGEYLILNGRIPGLDIPMREMVAALVRTHRGSEPNPSKHPSVSQLDRANLEALRKLTALLRAADGLDTDHRQRVRSIRAQVGRELIELDVRLDDSARALVVPPPRKLETFERVFGRAVSVSIA
jgi:exopolyphosphatase/guanosine-5'-triphosphate,3'-diphosphate pyrophosphatase